MGQKLCVSRGRGNACVYTEFMAGRMARVLLLFGRGRCRRQDHHRSPIPDFSYRTVHAAGLVFDEACLLRSLREHGPLMKPPRWTLGNSAGLRDTAAIRRVHLGLAEHAAPARI